MTYQEIELSGEKIKEIAEAELSVVFEFAQRANTFCEWEGQKSFTYPNWSDSREVFLNENWSKFLEFAILALGNPLKVQPQDLKRVISAYQDPSYLNSLTRIFQTLIKNEMCEKEKIIWTGFIEDSGAEAVRQLGIESRKPNVSYLVITSKSLLLKNSNNPLTQKFPIRNLELDVIQGGFRFLKVVHDFTSEIQSAVIYSTVGTLNGQEVEIGGIQTHEYSENYFRLAAAFAIAKNFMEIKLKLIEDHFLVENIAFEEDSEFLTQIWSCLVESWGYGPNMIDNDLKIIIGLAKNSNLDSDCLDEMIRFELGYILESRQEDSEIVDWLHALSNRADLTPEQSSTILEIQSKLSEKV